jgi:NAD-dependent deacetylase
MHGELKKVRCTATGQVQPWEQDIEPETLCPCCQRAGTLRPHIVWFGETPFAMDTIDDALRRCDLFLSIGTSGNVYPAAGFVHQVKALGHGDTVELNLEPSLGHPLFDECIYGPATQVVPEYVERLLQRVLRDGPRSDTK